VLTASQREIQNAIGWTMDMILTLSWHDAQGR
jgi:hypothetical protein